MSEYLKFVVLEEKAKTKVIAVCSKRHGDRLATISWFGPWRQYVFKPQSLTIWNDGCLGDVLAFLAELKEQRRKHGRARSTDD